MTTTTVKAANAAEFLSFVPHLLGFHASHSLVLVPFARSRTIAAMRLDLPPYDVEVDAFAATCIGMVCRVGAADAVAAIVYTDEPVCDGSAPREALVTALLEKAHVCGLHVVDALWVGPEGWGSFLSADAAPRSLDELRDVRSAVGALAEPHGDQASGSELPETDPARVADVAEALRALEIAVDAVCDPPGEEGLRVDPSALQTALPLDDFPSLYESMLSWDPAALTPYECAAALWCLERPALRDVALIGWTVGPDAADRAFAAQLRWDLGEAYPMDLARVLWGEAPTPDASRLDSALRVARAVAAAAPPEHSAGPLSVCAWLSWALGRSTHAESYAARAYDAEPGHTLAEIVLSMVAAGHLPDWTFRRRPRS
ncbi:DUF4192 family protein [Microbacterium sp. BWT-B31]|uniref:DUF4192 family protein n=1 Tax=Microbacterium sp. BWT-B31 TaxID=3232072 RepID=UPI003527A539